MLMMGTVKLGQVTQDQAPFEVADEDYLRFGLSGEIAAVVAEQIGRLPLKAGVKRLGVPNVPIPYSRPLEQAVIPQVGHITQALRGLVAG